MHILDQMEGAMTKAQGYLIYLDLMEIHEVKAEA